MSNGTVNFDDAYWAYLPTPVQALRGITDPTQRAALVQTLIGQGFAQYIDAEIMLNGWDALTTMQIRIEWGNAVGVQWTWTPSALQLPLGAPNGYTLPGVPPESDLNQKPYVSSPAPANSCKVSANASDFPPYQPAPVTPPVNPPADPVGPQVGALNMYLNNPGAEQYPIGYVYVGDPRGTFQHVGAVGPMGTETYWTLITPAPAAAAK